MKVKGRITGEGRNLFKRKRVIKMILNIEQCPPKGTVLTFAFFWFVVTQVNLPVSLATFYLLLINLSIVYSELRLPKNTDCNRLAVFRVSSTELSDTPEPSPLCAGLPVFEFQLTGVDSVLLTVSDK